MSSSSSRSVSSHLEFVPAAERDSLATRAYLNIRERILKGHLPLGAQLSRRKLASELGVSLLPVSEALQRLESEGLVETEARIGTRVCRPTANDIRERYEVREALETQAVRLFAERATARDRVELMRMASNMDTMFNRCFTPGSQDPDFLFAVHSYHFQLHLRIAECTGCRALVAAIERNQILIFNWLFDVAAQRPALPPRFHYELALAISEGTVEDADRAMRAHIRFGLGQVVDNIEPLQPPPPAKRPRRKPKAK